MGRGGGWEVEGGFRTGQSAGSWLQSLGLKKGQEGGKEGRILRG